MRHSLRARLPVGQVFGNVGALLGGRLLLAGLGWVGTLIIAAHLSEAQFGKFSLVFSILGMLSIVTDMGIGRLALAGVMDPARDRGALAGTYVLLRTCLGLVGYLVAVGFVVAAGYDADIIRTTLIAGLVVVFATPSNAYNLPFQATMSMPKIAYAEVVGQFCRLALTIVVVLQGGGIALLAIPAVAGEIVILLLKVRPAHGILRFRYHIDRSVWWRLFREAAPISVGTAMVTMYFRVDSIMLSKLDTFDSVGMYAVAYKFVDLTHFVATSLSLPFLTLLVAAWPSDMERFRATIRRGVHFLTVAAVLIVVPAIIFARPLVTTLFREKYADASTATAILIPAECVGFFATFAFAILVATQNHRSYPIIAVAGLVLNVVLNLVTIPRWSFEAAAVNTLLTEALVGTLVWRVIRRIPGVRPLGLASVARAPIVVAAGCAVGWLSWQVVPWLVAAPLSIATALALLHVLAVTGPGGLRALRGGDGLTIPTVENA